MLKIFGVNMKAGCKYETIEFIKYKWSYFQNEMASAIDAPESS